MGKRILLLKLSNTKMMNFLGEAFLEAKKDVDLCEVPLVAVGFSYVGWVEELTGYSFTEFMLIAKNKLISREPSADVPTPGQSTAEASFMKPYKTV
nr:hypothetical protein [Tanacetum cinerariifolium]